jgi:dihydroflavonol-4-reductase
MKRKYLVTGAAGHLGNTLVNMLFNEGSDVRALVLKSDEAAVQIPDSVEVFTGDVRDKDSLRAFFERGSDDLETEYIVIHTAGIVTIATKFKQIVHDVNVTGTRNIVDLCLEYKADKLIYVSSVHAIPELAEHHVITEISEFDPAKVVGLYARTKAEATAIVLDACKRGLYVSVVHPSGICGPYDYGNGHTTQLLVDFYKGSLTAGIKGGYDFVDVRDVAQGIISCCDKGGNMECYILSNRYFSVEDLFKVFHEVTGRKKITTILPMWFAKGTARLSELYYKILSRTPLYTLYSLYTLSSNSNFSHEKAERELGYTVRPFTETVLDTVDWLKTQNRL